MEVQPISINHNEQTKGDCAAAATEVTANRSVIGKLLYMGRLINAVLPSTLPQSGDQVQQLHLNHVCELNATMKTFKNFAVSVTYFPSLGGAFNLETLSDASVKEARGDTNLPERMLFSCICAESLHQVNSMSLFVRGVTRSTTTSELLAAAHVANKITYFKYLFDEITKAQTTKLETDSGASLLPLFNF